MNDLHLDRLRVKVKNRDERYASAEYKHDNLPEGLKPYVEQAIEDITNSGNPIQSRTYEVGERSGDCRIHVMYKPIYKNETIYHHGNAWTGSKGGKKRVRTRIWP